MRYRRIGKFSVSMHAFENNDDIWDLANCFALMKFVALRIEHVPHNKLTLYEGWSDMFEEIEEGQVIPSYDVVIMKDTREPEMTVEVKKLDA